MTLMPYRHILNLLGENCQWWRGFSVKKLAVKSRKKRNNIKMTTDELCYIPATILFNEAEKIQTAINKSGLKKPDWARNALISAAQASN
jgi:hypothetical protein